jgi:ADP-heptose:LPS heptosyltransferase
MSTLLYHAGALGDFIAVLPALSAWRRLHPHDPVTYLGRRSHGELGLHFRRFEEAWDADRAVFAPLFAPQPDAGAIEGLARFDAALLFADDDAPLVANVKHAGVATVLHQPPFPARRIHAIDYHLSLLRGRHTPDDDPTVQMPLLPVDATAGSSSTAIIHPGSGSALKNWPLDRFAAVADALQERGLTVLWLLGPAEVRFTMRPTDRVVHAPSLVDLALLLASCRVYVGNDSGITHLAAAVGCPTIAIFGPSDPGIWAPRGPHVRIVAGECPASGPCHRASRRPRCLDRDCLTGITIDRVIDAIRSLEVMTGAGIR